MNKVFDVSLSNGKSGHCFTSLPAKDSELLDALDRLNMTPDEKPGWKIIQNDISRRLSPFLEGCSLYEINDLSLMLGNMDQRQLAAFEGLLQMASQRGEKPSITDLLTYANSVDCCHVVGEVTNDAQLGRFYAENDFLPELVDIPDDLYEKLDFSKIGRETREADGGVFTKYGYIMRHDELRPYTEPVGAIPQAPDYVFRVGLYALRDIKKLASLDLPATSDQITQTLEKCGVTSWLMLDYRIEDSTIPDRQQKESMEHGTLIQLNELAQAVKFRQERGELPKLKAVLDTVDYVGPDFAARIAEDLDKYLYEPDKHNVEDFARARLRSFVDEQALPLLLEHINLISYGLDLMEAEKVTMTPYGVVRRQDEGMLLTPEGGMKLE